MEQPVSWRQRFKISNAESKLTLSEALISGRIPEAEYFAWAKETYGLPVVTDSFFVIPEDPIYWESICRLFNWTCDLFPLTEWDGIVLIGCVEPPQDFRFRRDHRFVLVSPKHLHSLWSKLNPDSKIMTNIVPLEQLMETATREETPGEESDELPDLEMPVGMLSVEDLDLKIPQSVKKPSEPVQVAMTPPPLPKTAPSLQVAAPPAIATSVNEVSHARVVIPKGEPKEILACETFEEISSQALVHLSKTFKSAMVLLHEKTVLVPWQWTPALDSPSAPGLKSISMTDPSIFSIVSRSKLPFHGGVRTSPENIRVFAAFGNGTLPLHATLVPVMVEGNLIAMLLGLNDAPMDYRFVLPMVEKLATEVAEQISKFGTEKAA